MGDLEAIKEERITVTLRLPRRPVGADRATAEPLTVHLLDRAFRFLKRLRSLQLFWIYDSARISLIVQKIEDV